MDVRTFSVVFFAGVFSPPIVWIETDLYIASPNEMSDNRWYRIEKNIARMIVTVNIAPSLIDSGFEKLIYVLY
jgi:hypothetical protein